MSPKRILAIRFARLGDVILLFPALANLKTAFPDAHLTLMTGHRFAAAARLGQMVDDVFPVDRIAMRDSGLATSLRMIGSLVSAVRRQHYDLVLDFHSFRETNLLAWTTAAPQRLGMKRADRAYLGFCFNLPPVVEDKSIHVGEMFERVVQGVPGAETARRSDDAPLVRLPSAREVAAAAILPDKPFAALFVGARAQDHRWPASKFAELARRIHDRMGVHIILLDGSREGSALEVERLLGEAPYARTLSGLNLDLLAAVMARASVLVSNDTGPMHLGAAVAVPTLGLFSYSDPAHYRPYSSRGRFLQADRIEDIPVDAVEQMVKSMLAGAASGQTADDHSVRNGPGFREHRMPH